jgi:hypothetical protein
MAEYAPLRGNEHHMHSPCSDRILSSGIPPRSFAAYTFVRFYVENKDVHIFFVNFDHLSKHPSAVMYTPNVRPVRGAGSVASK